VEQKGVHENVLKFLTTKMPFLTTWDMLRVDTEIVARAVVAVIKN
jgi:hypothetical protein